MSGSSPLRILSVSNFFPGHLGGIELVAERLNRGFAEAGHDVTWAACGTPPPDRPNLRHLPLPTFNTLETLIDVPWPVPSPGALRRLARAAREADVVHLHDALYLHTAFAAASARARVVTQHISSIPYRNGLLRAAHQIMNRTVGRYVLSRAERVVFLSKEHAEYFGRFTHFRKPAEMIPNGVDAALFRPAENNEERSALRAKAGLPPGTRAVLFVGRRTPKKGFELVLEAARLRPADIFIFAGPFDAPRTAPPNTRFFPRHPHAALRDLYVASDALVLPSVGEGFPLVVQEAMACGLPCVVSTQTATLLGGAERFVTSCERTATGVANALDSAALMDTAAAMRYAREKWDWAKTVERYLAIFRDSAGTAGKA